MKDYRDLIVWQKGIALTVEIYKIVKLLPKDETYGLSSQMRRAAVSIPSNIAEGYARKSTKEYINFLSIAQGSRAELQTQLYICEKLEYINCKQMNLAQTLVDEVGRMLTSLIKSLEDKVLVESI